MTVQRFEYQGRSLSVLELARLVLPESGQVPAEPAAPSLPVVVEQTTLKVILKRKGRRMSKTRRLGFLWLKAADQGLAVCPDDRRRVKRGECLHCQLECIASGIG